MDEREQNERELMNTSYKRKVYMVTAAVVVLILLSIGLVIYGMVKPAAKPSPSVEKKEQAATEGDASVLPEEDPLKKDYIGKTYTTRGYIYEVDTENSVVTLFSIEEDANISFMYTGATDIKTSYGKVISASILKKGEFFDAVYNDSHRLVSLTGVAGAWIYDDILNMAIDTERQRILVGESIFRYNDYIHVLENGVFRGLEDISSRDVFGIRGIDNYVYVIEVSKSHGQLEFSKEEVFLDANILIDGNLVEQLSENTSITLTEGTYFIEVVNDEASASGNVTIEAHETTQFDLSGFAPEPVRYGEVKFTISPSGADLWIDGNKVGYGSAITLAYGTHKVEAELGGYVSYSGSFELAKDKMALKITLPATPMTPTPVPENQVVTENDSDAMPSDEEDAEYDKNTDEEDENEDSDSTEDEAADNQLTENVNETTGSMEEDSGAETTEAEESPVNQPDNSIKEEDKPVDSTAVDADAPAGEEGNSAEEQEAGITGENTVLPEADSAAAEETTSGADGTEAKALDNE